MSASTQRWVVVAPAREKALAKGTELIAVTGTPCHSRAFVSRGSSGMLLEDDICGRFQLNVYEEGGRWRSNVERGGCPHQESKYSQFVCVQRAIVRVEDDTSVMVKMMYELFCRSSLRKSHLSRFSIRLSMGYNSYIYERMGVTITW